MIQSFGDLVFQRRSALGLTQADVAARAGISRQYYNRIENSSRVSLQPETVDKVAQALRLGKPESQHLQKISCVERFLLSFPGTLSTEENETALIFLASLGALDDIQAMNIRKKISEEIEM